MVKVYGMSICPHCVNAIEKLKEANIEHEFLDFCKDTKNLKEFLKIRDHLAIFDHARHNGNIGIPVFVTSTMITKDITKIIG